MCSVLKIKIVIGFTDFDQLHVMSNLNCPVGLLQMICLQSLNLEIETEKSGISVTTITSFKTLWFEQTLYKCDHCQIKLINSLYFMNTITYILGFL